MTLHAYRYDTRGGAIHLRCRQSQFSEAAKAALQRVGSPARWMPADQSWDWPISPTAVIALARVAQELNEEIEWQSGLKEYADAHIKQAANEHEVRIAIERVIRDGSPLEGYVTRLVKDNGEEVPPARHQQISYHWAQRTLGLLLAHDPGCGKTRSAADASGGWYRHGLIRPMSPAFFDGKPGVEGGVLVVCPKTVIRTWQDELRLWQSASSVSIYGSSVKKTRLSATLAHYHIVNYEGLKYVTHNKYDALIIDEIHRCGNHTHQTMNVLGISQQVRRKIGLSGTPISNALESIFYPMLIIDGGKTLGSSRTAFLEKYFSAVVIPGIPTPKYDPTEEAPRLIAAAMAESTYFVKKEEVLDLPPKTHTPVYLEMTAEQLQYYQQIKNEAITYIQDATVTVEQASARMMKLLQICQGFALVDDDGSAKERAGRHFTDAKTEALMDMLTGELSGRKVVLWAMFTYEIQRLVNALTARGIPHVRIDGTIKSQRTRDAALDSWNNDPHFRVFIRQISMSEGVTMHAKESTVPCFDCIYMGLSYRYIDWIQSQDRIHRMGQKYSCNYTYFLTENGVDRSVYNAVLEKSQNAAAVHAMGKDFFLNLIRGEAA